MISLNDIIAVQLGINVVDYVHCEALLTDLKGRDTYCFKNQVELITRSHPCITHLQNNAQVTFSRCTSISEIPSKDEPSDDTTAICILGSLQCGLWHVIVSYSSRVVLFLEP